MVSTGITTTDPKQRLPFFHWISHLHMGAAKQCWCQPMLPLVDQGGLQKTPLSKESSQRVVLQPNSASRLEKIPGTREDRFEGTWKK
jgi:hypothetical protein